MQLPEQQLHATDPLLEELSSVEEKKSSWVKKLFLFLLFVIGIVAFLFACWVGYYYFAFRNGDVDKLRGVVVDATSYSKYGEVVSRGEVETFDDPYTGPADAKLVIVEFGDFGCPFCKENYPDIKKIRDEYASTVKFIYRDFPLVYIHPEAQIAAEAAECAHAQNMFWEYHDFLYERQGTYTTQEELIGFAKDLGLDEEKFTKCVTTNTYRSEVAQDLSDGIRFKIKGTPTYFINGLKLNGTVSYETMKQLVEKYLERI